MELEAAAERRRGLVLEAVSRYYVLVAGAEAAGVSVRTVQRWAAEDAEYGREWGLAREAGHDRLLMRLVSAQDAESARVAALAERAAAAAETRRAARDRDRPPAPRVVSDRAEAIEWARRPVLEAV